MCFPSWTQKLAEREFPGTDLFIDQYAIVCIDFRIIALELIEGGKVAVQAGQS